MKPTQSHLNEAQRIFDRLGRGSVADIDAIARALAEAERGGMLKASEIVQEVSIAYAEDEAGWLDCCETIDGIIRKEAES